MAVHHLSRRTFIQTGLSTAAALSAAGPALGALGANDRIRVGVIGTGGRGNSQMTSMGKQENVEIVAVCDVDDAHLDRACKTAEKAGGKPERYKDYRRVIDRKDIDAVFVVTCCHWHAIPAIAAMKAGKDVYVEKPIGHTIHEGRLIADTAKETNRVVQVGLQQRSVPHWQHAVQKIKAGELGRITAVHAWNGWAKNELGGTMGNPPDGDPPPGVDYDMWLGPAPKRPFNPARFHYNFYFFFDYSSGMINAWGVHLFDIIRWAMGDNLKSVSTAGGIYVLKDARDTPDTAHAVFDCGDYVLDYSLSHTSGWRRFGNMDHGIEFAGTEGVLQINRHMFQMFHGRETQPHYEEKNKSDDTVLHQRNFFECMRSRKTPNVDALQGHLSSALGYLAIISYRVGRQIRWDAKNETIPGDAEAAKLLTKEYRAPYQL